MAYLYFLLHIFIIIYEKQAFMNIYYLYIIYLVASVNARSLHFIYFVINI